MDQYHFFTTKVTVEVTISHQLDPQLAIRMIVVDSLQCHAVENIHIVEAHSNYSDFQDVPTSLMHPVDLTRLYK